MLKIFKKIWFNYATHLAIALQYFRRWKTNSSRHSWHRCSGSKLQAKSQRKWYCVFEKNVFSVNIFIISDENCGRRNSIFAVLKCIFYANISNIIGTQNFTSLPQDIVDRVQGCEGPWVVVVANEVIPVSRSLVTGIQYHYILLLLFMGCFASSHGSCGGEETERERKRKGDWEF
jgi:hypothetical protein